MEAGKLRHQITIQVMDTNETWSDRVSCQAQVNGLSGSEYWAASAEQAQNSVDFIVRYASVLANLVPQTTRILFRGQIYDVKSIDNFMYQNRSLKLRAVMHFGR
jgi:SPP1 family predicted phage head-tail adaptor